MRNCMLPESARIDLFFFLDSFARNTSITFDIYSKSKLFEFCDPSLSLKTFSFSDNLRYVHPLKRITCVIMKLLNLTK